MRFILIALLLALIAVFSIHTLTDLNQDLGLHLTTGKIIWQTHSVPMTNYFSYTYPDFEFTNHHWLGQVFLYLLSQIYGLEGLILAQGLLLTSAFTLTFFAYYRKEMILNSVLVGIISVLILIDRSAVRPELFSFLFLGLYIYILFKKANTNWMWLLPAIQLVWINTHIYFFLGPAVYLFFIIGRYTDHIRRQATIKERWNRLIFVGILSGVVNFINPFGWMGALSPLFVINDFGVPILELLSPIAVLDFGYPRLSIYTFFIAIILGAISFFINRKNWKNNIFEFLLFILFAALSLAMIRNMALFALVMLPITIKNQFQADIRWENLQAQIFSAVILFILILCVMTNQIQGGFGRQFGLIIPDWGQKAVDFIVSNHIQGPVFNNINAGSYLLWKLPEQKVFIDTHPEAYPKDFVKKIFIPMQADTERWKEYSDKYDINYVFYAYNEMTPWSKMYLYNMSRDENWPIIFMDKDIVIFLKNTPENSEIIKKYRITAKYN